MIAPSSIPTPVWFVGWVIAGFNLARLPGAWSLVAAVPLAGLVLLVHLGLGRRPSVQQARTYPRRSLTGTEHLCVLGATALVLAVTFTSTLTGATTGTPVSAAEYQRSLQLSPGVMLLFAPVLCEVFFRGWLLTRLRRPDGSVTWLAMIGGAFLFGLAARALAWTGAFGTLPSAFALGLTATILLVTTGSFLAPLLLHILHNSALLLMAWVAQSQLSPLLAGQGLVTTGVAFAAEAVAVLAWATALHLFWKRRARGDGGTMKSLGRLEPQV